MLSELLILVRPIPRHSFFCGWKLYQYSPRVRPTPFQDLWILVNGKNATIVLRENLHKSGFVFGVLVSISNGDLRDYENGHDLGLGVMPL